MKQKVLSVLAGLVIAHVWSMVSWMACNWHSIDFREFSDGGESVASAIKDSAPTKGIYMIPNYSEEKTQEVQQRWWEAAAKGPYAFMTVHPNGLKASMGANVAVQLALHLLCAVMATALLSLFGWGCWLRKGLLVGGTVTMGALLSYIPLWTWWGFPGWFVTINILTLFIGWTLAGFAMGKILPSLKRPEPTA